MIESKSPTILHINKLSVLLVSCLLLLLWVNLELTKSPQSTSNKNIPDNSKHQSRDSKYLKTLSVNPFLRSHDEAVSNDEVPTVTALQSSIPSFASLNLRLHGIVYQRENGSYAMISMNSAIQEIVSVNDAIAEGLYLIDIAKKQVIVDYFGERHVLFMDNSRIIKSPIQTSSTEENEQISSENFNQQIEFLEVDKQRNPIRLFMIRRPYAVYKNGEFQGYKIMPGSNADQFKRLGFQSGDIITYLNGIEFTGPGKKEYVIQQLTHAMHIDLTVIRGEQELTINYGF